MFPFCCLHPCLARWISGVISHGLHVGTHNQDEKGDNKEGEKEESKKLREREAEVRKRGRNGIGRLLYMIVR